MFRIFRGPSAPSQFLVIHDMRLLEVPVAFIQGQWQVGDSVTLFVLASVLGVGSRTLVLVL